MRFTIPFLLLAVFTPYASAAGVFTSARITGDADSGISTVRTYTHAVDFASGDSGTSINGVTFQIGGQVAPNYSTTGFSAYFPFFNTASAPSGPNTLDDLLSDFYYNGTGAGPGVGNESLTLTGLTPGTAYTTTFYNAGFDAPRVTRIADITTTDGGSTTFDQNAFGQGAPSVLRYTFVATAPSITYTFDARNNFDTFHQYGFTNEVVPEPSAMGVAAFVAVALLRRRH